MGWDEVAEGLAVSRVAPNIRDKRKVRRPGTKPLLKSCNSRQKNSGIKRTFESAHTLPQTYAPTRHQDGGEAARVAQAHHVLIAHELQVRQVVALQQLVAHVGRRRLGAQRVAPDLRYGQE